MPNTSLARSASHFRNQESENKNREIREKREKIEPLAKLPEERSLKGGFRTNGEIFWSVGFVAVKLYMRCV
jgi:hypothetical protein